MIQTGLMRRWAVAAGTALLLVGCGGGGGGDRAAGVGEGPPPPNQTPPPLPSPPSSSVSTGDLDEDSDVTSEITGVTLASPPTITFTLIVDGFLTIDDLTTGDLRVSFAALENGAEPESRVWQSLITTTEDPVCRTQADIDNSNNACTQTSNSTDPVQDPIPDEALKVQDPVAFGRLEENHATTEREGTLSANDDGTWSYALSTDPGDPATLDNLHRICVQFSLEAFPGNPCVDFVPSEVAAAGDGTTGTSLEPGFYDMNDSRQVAATASCNSCHDEIAFHGGGRREIDYCTTCHNPDTIDANSTNSMDMPVLIHRIHYSANIPSIDPDDPDAQYKVWGFRNGEHNYSDVSYPQMASNCTRCHAGQEDADRAEAEGLPPPVAEITPDGYHWASKPSGAACGACHENNGHLNALEGRCTECHIEGGVAGSVEDSHVNDVIAAAGNYRLELLNVTSTGAGEAPVIDFRIVDPGNGDAPYDILNDDPFVQGGGASRIAVTVGWSTDEYTNTGNGDEEASTVSINALSDAEDQGGGVFRVVSPVAIPDGSLAPNVAADGSGAVTIEGHPAEDLDGEIERIPVTNTLAYFAIDDPSPVPRREVVTLEQCNACHDRLVLHGNNRTDLIEGCVTCHNPRNTDREVREIASDPPTDGKDEESVNFTTMIHGIHAAGVRENPLEVVGFGGFTTHRYTEEDVQYPGDLADCTSCHADESFALPLAAGVLGTTIDTGDDHQDPADDVVVSPASAVCSSCHDAAASVAHMESNGGSFSTSQAALDDNTVVEQCEVCHRSGASSDVAIVHGLD